MAITVIAELAPSAVFACCVRFRQDVSLDSCDHVLWGLSGAWRLRHACTIRDGDEEAVTTTSHYPTGVAVIRIMIVDDVESVRRGIVAFLSVIPDLAVVGTCADGSEAVTVAREVGPDVVLMDVSMPVVDGITATSLLLAEWPAARVVILSSSADGDVVHRARMVGAVGYVLKSGNPDDLVSAVHAAAEGRQWWCGPASEALRHAN